MCSFVTVSKKWTRSNNNYRENIRKVKQREAKRECFGQPNIIGWNLFGESNQWQNERQENPEAHRLWRLSAGLEVLYMSCSDDQVKRYLSLMLGSLYEYPVCELVNRSQSRVDYLGHCFELSF